jgi:hypothetical protein
VAMAVPDRGRRRRRRRVGKCGLSTSLPRPDQVFTISQRAGSQGRNTEKPR